MMYLLSTTPIGSYDPKLIEFFKCSTLEDVTCFIDNYIKKKVRISVRIFEPIEEGMDSIPFFSGKD